MSIKIPCNNTIEVKQIYVDKGDSIQIILGRQYNFSIFIDLSCSLDGERTLLWNDGKEAQRKTWHDPKNEEETK